MARPRANDPKSERLMARVTDAEAKHFRELAAAAGVKPSDWIRAAMNVAAGKSPIRNPVAHKDDLAAVLRHVGMIGSNVNQMARKANMGSWPEAEALQHAQQDIRMIRDQLMKALGVKVPASPEP